MNRPKLWMDREPDTFRRVLALFPAACTLQVKYAEPDRRRFRWSRLQARAERVIAKIRRTAA